MTNPSTHPRISVSLISARSWPVEQSLQFLGEAGVEAISLTLAHLGDEPSVVIPVIKDSGLKVAMLGTGGACLVEDAETALSALKPLVDATKALGCPSAFTVSGPVPPTMTTDEAFERLASNIAPASAYARENGVRLGVENNSTVTRQLGFLSTLADTVELAEKADLGVVVELQNCWQERHLKALFRDHAKRFVIVNVNDFKLGEDPRFNRRVPGDGSMPLERLIGDLLEAGYAGYFDIEFLGPAIEEEGYASAIARSLDWLASRLHKWGV